MRNPTKSTFLCIFSVYLYMSEVFMYLHLYIYLVLHDKVSGLAFMEDA